jgi:hypothetical protein
MSHAERVDERRRADDSPDGPPVCLQVTPVGQLLRLQSAIEGQSKPVALAITPIAEALDNGSNVSHEMMNHLEAQILRAQVQLDALEELLDTIASRFQGGASTPFATIVVLEEPAGPAQR